MQVNRVDVVHVERARVHVPSVPFAVRPPAAFHTCVDFADRHA